MAHLVNQALGFLSQYKLWLIGGAALIFAALFVQDKFNDYVEAERLEARTEAVAECNTTQLEEDKRVLEQRLADAEAANLQLRNDLNDQEADRRAQQAFIRSLQGQLQDFDDDDISDRTRRFMELMSERAERFYDDPILEE